ncbi:GDSL-type esterase/lipase family protein [Akkermansiaceae bacterium]|nr:GDSL-type esterase/lipase family protein [Akkermansiaceae bacterium]
MIRPLLFLALSLPLLADPAKWEKDIAKFEAADKKSAPPKNAHLFIGSSSVRMWDLKKSFPKITTINRGFGGSELEDSLHFADRIVIPYQPKAVYLYAGDNDIGNGKTVETVISDYQKFVKKVHASLPKTDIVFIPIKPSTKRWDLWPKMNKANFAIQKISQSHPKLHYIDIPAAMLITGQPPAADLFLKDGLHMSDKGYEMWNTKVIKWLKKNANR